MSVHPFVVTGLWQHPVKSAQGRAAEEVTIDALGVVGDHRWALRAISTGDANGGWDERRFRMNIVVSADADAERAMVGSRVRVGTAVCDVVKEVDRCVMVTRPQPGVERDFSVLSHINQHRSGNLGVGMMVVETGTVRRGDAVVVVGPIPN